ncbi:hypothetical protein [Frondihabitans peucedani]|uniref:Transposase n=1 Tax=Frondihabitans peucedani TaxID=598626 RepID=A0ABP8DY00_9MICO
MPVDQWYDDATQEAATARVLQRLFTNPGDKSVFRVVSDEFSVDERSLRAWVEAASPTAALSKKKARPKFSPVVRTRIEPRDDEVEVPEGEGDAEPDDDNEGDGESEVDFEPVEEAAVDEAPAEPEAVAEEEPEVPVEVQEQTLDDPAEDEAADPAPETDARADTDVAGRVAELEAEAARLRGHIEAYKGALRALLDD